MDDPSYFRVSDGGRLSYREKGIMVKFREIDCRSNGFELRCYASAPRYISVRYSCKTSWHAHLISNNEARQCIEHKREKWGVHPVRV